MSKKHAYLAVVVASVLVLGGCDKAESFFGNNDKSGELVQRIEIKENDGSANMPLPGSAQLFEQEGQAVVNIQATRAVKSADNSEENSMGLGQFPDSDPSYEFFKRLVPSMPDMPEQDENSDELNFSSDFIISQGGHILTNVHVAASMVNIKALLSDKRAYSAKLIGSDQQSDIALIKIDAKDPSMVEIGNPKDLKPGEWVATIGALFGLDNSITADIVSAKGRSLPNESHTSFIQTDVIISPSNSGGPLFNLRGQAISIDSQVYSRSGRFMGISFAIPIDVAMSVTDQIKKTGRMRRGQLRVIIQEVSYDLAKSFGLDKADDALVAKIMPNSPTAQVDLQVGDIVRSINGEEVRAFSNLPVMAGTIAPGKEIRLDIWHKGEEISVKARLDSVGALVETGSFSSSSPAKQSDTAGFTVENIGLTLQMQNSDNKQYLIITWITGATEHAGLKHSDEILAVNRITVGDESTFRNTLENAGKNVPLLVQHDSNTLFLVLNLQ